MIPEFNDDGNLPDGIHWTTWDEFFERFGKGIQRQFLIDGLKKVIAHLKNAGCVRVFIDGSFTTSKELPNDYDMCWEITGVNPHLLDPVLLDFSNVGRALQKRIYSGDIFPAQQKESSCGMAIINFFQIDKATGNTKGIIAINL